MTDEQQEHFWAVFWAGLGTIAVLIVVAVILLGVGELERVTFDECLKTNTAAYCTLQHPAGSH